MKDFDLKIVAERIKELRQDEKLSLIDLGKIIGVSAIAISRWENQKRIPTIDNLFKLAQFFKVSVDYLVGLED